MGAGRNGCFDGLSLAEYGRAVEVVSSVREHLPPRNFLWNEWIVP